MGMTLFVNMYISTHLFSSFANSVRKKKKKTICNALAQIPNYLKDEGKKIEYSLFFFLYLCSKAILKATSKTIEMKLCLGTMPHLIRLAAIPSCTALTPIISSFSSVRHISRCTRNLTSSTRNADLLPPTGSMPSLLERHWVGSRPSLLRWTALQHIYRPLSTSPLFAPPRRPARVTAFNPWKQRPSGLARHGRPQMVHPHYFHHGYKRANPDDPTRLLPASHVLLKRCRLCQRTRFVPLAQKDFFHTCCEGEPMRLLGNMKTVQNAEHKLLQAVRQWDVNEERPHSRPHRPKPKGRSKLKK